MGTSCLLLKQQIQKYTKPERKFKIESHTCENRNNNKIINMANKRFLEFT